MEQTAPSINTRSLHILQNRLFDALDLASHAKQAHWTVRGANFQSLHLIFDQLAMQMNGISDDIAERAMVLGGGISGTVRATAEGSSLSEFPVGIISSSDHLSAITASLEALISALRTDVEELSDTGDLGTADLMTSLLADLEKTQWMIKAHIE